MKNEKIRLDQVVTWKLIPWEKNTQSNTTKNGKHLTLSIFHGKCYQTHVSCTMFIKFSVTSFLQYFLLSVILDGFESVT